MRSRVTRFRAGFSALATLTAMGSATAASAQSPAQTVEADDVVDGDADDSANADIIVTAQRRSERLQDVPVAVSAFDAEALERLNVQGTKDLTAVTPGLNFTQSVYSPQPTIRGIGLRGVGSGDESVVPIYIDGIYQPFIAGADLQFNNVERIEVLKGPQGALLGRNATGGAINIITRTPPDGREARISLSYGRFDQVVAKAYAGIGSERFGVGVALLSNRDNGYIKDLVTGRRYADTQDLSARARVRFTPSERFELTLAGSHTSSTASTGEAYRPFRGNSIGARVPGNTFGVAAFSSALTQDPFNNLKASSLSATGVVNFDQFSVTSVTGYQDSHLKIFADSDGTRADIANISFDQVSESIYHETYVTSKLGGPIEFIGGVVYYDSEDGTPFQRIQSRTVSAAGALGPIALSELSSVGHTTSYAGYLQGTYQITEALSLTAGGRYTSEKRDAKITRPGGIILTNKATFKKFTPTVTIQYRPNSDFNIYAKYGEAFKSGILNLGATTQAALTPVRPENVKQIEVGVKARLARNLQFNAAAYYTDYKNLQSSARNAIGQSMLQNAGSAKIYGGEAELRFTPTRQLSLFAGISALHGEYRDFPNSQVSIPASSGDASNPTACFVNPGALVGGNRTVICDVSGNKIIRTPFLQVSAGFDYQVPVGDGEIGLSGKGYYSGYSYWDTLSYFKEPSYVLLGGEISWRPGSDDLKFSLWGDNLLDEKYSLTLTTSGTAASQVLARPRTYGVRVTSNF